MDRQFYIRGTGKGRSLTSLPYMAMLINFRAYVQLSKAGRIITFYKLNYYFDIINRSLLKPTFVESEFTGLLYKNNKILVEFVTVDFWRQISGIASLILYNFLLCFLIGVDPV